MLSRRICILSYQSLHKKTMDTLIRLKMHGYTNVCVYAKAFHYKKTFKPLIEHRPSYQENDNLYTFDYKTLIRNLGYQLCEIEDYEDINEDLATIFLSCGAGILPDSFISKYKVMNVHPGYIPYVRGLDAFKWAISEKQPLGITLHRIKNEVDAGEIIKQKLVPVYENDSFHSLAYRQYDMEVELLVESVEWNGEILKYTDGENYPVHRRMPHELEQKLMLEFEDFKKSYAEILKNKGILE